MSADPRACSLDNNAERSSSLREFFARDLIALGVYGFAFLSRHSFLEVLAECRVSETMMRKYDALKAESVIVTALRYGEGDYAPPLWAALGGDEITGEGGAARPGHPAAKVRIARFARAHWYKELSERMRIAVERTIGAAAAMGISLPSAKAWHRLVNSGLPEKPLAEKAGLGWIGKNGIVIAASARGKTDDAPAHCSAVVLGLILCPVDLEAAPPLLAPAMAHRLCGDCRRCVDAWPTGALGCNGATYERERCIQHWTAIAGEIPADVKAVWDGRLYGCDSCLEACPHFIPDPSASSDIGRLGPALPAAYFIGNDDGTIRRDLSGTALGMGWMSIAAFRRNALMSEEGKNP